MDKITQLKIRACKSSNPEKRLNSIYRRFYLAGGSQLPVSLGCSWLSNIMDEFLDVPHSKVLRQVQATESYYRMSDKPAPETHNALYSAYQHIVRFSKWGEFEGLTVPYRIRNKQQRLI